MKALYSQFLTEQWKCRSMEEPFVTKYSICSLLCTLVCVRGRLLTVRAKGWNGFVYKIKPKSIQEGTTVLFAILYAFEQAWEVVLHFVFKHLPAVQAPLVELCISMTFMSSKWCISQDYFKLNSRCAQAMT